MIKLKDSGYSPGIRHKVVAKAKQIYQLQLQKDKDGIKPLYRPRHLIDSDRAAAKNPSYKWWNKRGTPHNAVMFVPPTPGGELLRRLKNRQEQLSSNSDFKIKFIEQGGLKLKHLLVKSDPFPTQECATKLCVRKPPIPNLET